MLQRLPVSLIFLFYAHRRNLVTFGSPHQGVFGIPECEAEVPVDSSFLLLWKTFTLGGKCPSMRAGATIDLSWGLWALDPGLRLLWNSSFGTQQDLVAPAQYWHDPFNQTHFLVDKRWPQGLKKKPPSQDLTTWLTWTTSASLRTRRTRRCWPTSRTWCWWCGTTTPPSYQRSSNCKLNQASLKFIQLMKTFLSVKLFFFLFFGHHIILIKSNCAHSSNQIVSKESAHFGFYALEQDTEVEIFLLMILSIISSNARF